MNHLNSLILEGDVINITSNAGGCVITIGVTRSYKNADGTTQDVVSYFDCECYGHLAKSVQEHTSAGKGIRVVGRLSQKRWEEDGVQKSKVFVVTEHVEYKGQ